MRTLTPNACGGLAPIALVMIERGEDQPALGLGQGGEGAREPGRLLVAGQLGRQMRRVDLLLGKDEGAVDHVLELTHVARPGAALEDRQRRGGEALVGAFLSVELAQEVVSQGGDVLCSRPQRRQVDREHLQPVEQIAAELALRDPGVEVAIGGGDDPHVDLQRFLPAQPRHHARLQHPQQLGLERRAASRSPRRGRACRRRRARSSRGGCDRRR